MKKTAVIYGSTTGTCQEIAQTIASKLGVGDVIDVSGLTADQVNGFEALILGSSTWGYGELQDDWFGGVNVLKSADLSGKTIAFFGCGDGDSYSDTFCDAMGLIYNEIKDSGCIFVGSVAISGYDFSDSASQVDGSFIGLALDDVNESDKTAERIDAWVEELKSAL